MTKLLTHFKLMQTACAAYVCPEPYTTHIPGATPVTHDAGDKAARDDIFINDMIYMLDGPEQREAQAEAQRMADQGYPTADAYTAACRALHWRTEQLRQAGIEPLDLAKLDFPNIPLPHYPPPLFRFPITEAFPGDDHRQIWHAWRRYPRAVKTTMAAFLMLGAVMGAGLGLLL